MKKIILASATVALAFGGFSCSETYDVYPESMSKVFMIKDAGTKNVVIYSAQDEVNGSVTVLKGGVAPDQAGRATLRALSDAEYNELAETSGVAYGQLPANCYSIEGGDLSFNGGEGYKQVNYTLDVKAVGEYLANLSSGSLTPAIFLTLESPDGNVNQDNSSMILVPDYRELTLGFEAGTGEITSSKAGDKVTFSGTLSLPIESQWNFTAELGVDPSGFDAVNDANYGLMSLMDAGSYEIVKQPTFVEGSSTADFQVVVDASKATAFDVLPLALKASGLDGLGLDQDAVLTTIDFKVPLTEDMLSTNAQEPSEGPIRNILDGSINSFFHTAWSVGVDGDHYIEVTLPETCTNVAWVWTNRNTGANNTPFRFTFSAGTNDNNLETVDYYDWWDESQKTRDDWHLDSGAGAMNFITPAPLSKPANVFRLTNHYTGSVNKFFCMSTLSVYAL